MTERSSEGLDVRRRKLLFRAWRRGVRETDLIVGRFADVYIDKFDDAGLDDFERLIEVPNAELYAWVVGARPCRRTTIPRCSPQLSRFHRSRARGAVMSQVKTPARRRRSGWRPAGRCCCPALPTAPKGLCSPISPAPSPPADAARDQRSR